MRVYVRDRQRGRELNIFIFALLIVITFILRLGQLKAVPFNPLFSRISWKYYFNLFFLGFYGAINVWMVISLLLFFAGNPIYLESCKKLIR